MPEPVEDVAVESALLVRVPEAEAAVARHRDRLDPSARRGVPAHVTVLYPVPVELSADELGRVAEAVRSVERFTCVLVATRWFGDDVLWLEPEPDLPFRALTRAVCAALPGVVPYGGSIAIDELVPHLTVGDRARGAALADLRTAEVEVVPMLPVRAEVAEVTWMRGGFEPGSWRVVDRFPLG